LLSELPLDPPSEAIDVSSVYTSLRLTGPRSSDVLAKVTSLNVADLDFPNLFCAQTSIAHAHAILMREDIGSILAFHILVSRDYGESLWESIIYAGDEFDLSPFGLTALQSLHP
jgi:heterotetrameric sarcosine oxidase gamma subunit